MATTEASIPGGATSAMDWRILLAPVVWAGALGYLVDIFDLNVGANFRQDLFHGFGVKQAETVQTLVDVTNWSRSGLLLGGFVWGILGDRAGRVISLFGSIALYSVVILATAIFCHTLAVYKLCQFAVGLGLAGELGGSVTLVLESMPATMRTFGVMLVAASGMGGVVLAGLLVEVASWRVGFGVGGVLGLALLVFRYHVRESILFQRLEHKKISRGNWFALLWPWPELRKYLACIFLGVAPLFVLYFYSGFAPEIGRELGLAGELKVNRASVAMFSGLAIGDFLVAWLSYRLRSRKRPILWFMAASAVMQVAIVHCRGCSATLVYALFVFLGMTTANALYVTTAAEQFGTNVRDTATTTVTNFIRFGVVPLGFLFTDWQKRIGLVPAGFLINLAMLTLGILALSRLRESYGSNIDFEEGDAPG